MIDELTKRWILNPADERAAERGCRFSQERADHVIEFFSTELVLYEGDAAGQPFVPMPWIEDFLSRLFGWERYSEHVGRWVRRFRKAALWCPKKQAKSPIGAGVGLYLMAADGEMGQKVYAAASSGRQADIMHKHAREMTKRSPRLSQECKIRMGAGKCSIEHMPTTSFYEIISTENIKGQEGLNGSVIIDETHVVDDRLAKVLEHMGASRSEPLQLEVSTAGNNPTGYGKHQFDYGEMVNRGDVEDDQFLHVAYGADPELTDEQLADPAVWEAANPSWGVTINPEEFAASFQRARRSLSDWVAFKMYRLNLWQAASNPWLMQSDWNNGKEKLSDSELMGMRCFGGLDCSMTEDMSALCLTFEDRDGSYHQRVWFWMPEDRAHAINHEAPFLEWAKKGWITLTPFSTIDYGLIQERIIELDSMFSIQGLVYDPRYANDITGRLEDHHGIPRIKFPQSTGNFTGPMDRYEGLLREGKLKHDGNPVLAWQAGHVAIKAGANDSRMPTKPSNRHDDHRSIDGVVAGIMSLFGSTHAPAKQESVYETRGLRSL